MEDSLPFPSPFVLIFHHSLPLEVESPKFWPGGMGSAVSFGTEPQSKSNLLRSGGNGDRLSKGRMAKFDPAQIQNPSTDRHKIWNRWLRPRDDPPCKISCKSVHWGFSANGWNITKIFLRYIYLFLLTDLQFRPPGGFSRAMARTTRPHARVKRFREPTFEVNI